MDGETLSLDTFWATLYEEHQKEGEPVPSKISSMNLEIDRVFGQIDMKNLVENLQEGFHIFHSSPNWICHKCARN